jgi:hypothetical protein
MGRAVSSSSSSNQEVTLAIVSHCGALACQIGYKNLNWTEDFV